MAKLMYDDEFIFWSRGPIALKITKSAVSSYITETWENEIESWSSDEEGHIPIFLEDVENGQIQLVAKKKRSERFKEIVPEYKCRHDLCKNILGRLQKLHQNPKKIDLKKGQSDEQYPIDDDWKLARMYSHGFEYPGSKPSTGPEDTEEAMVFKMMKNCKLFDLDDNGLYDQVRNVRNKLMHSVTLKLTQNELEVCINVMKSFLEAVHESEGHANEGHKCDGIDCDFNEDIQEAKRELDKLLERQHSFESIFQDIEMMRDAIEVRRNALESENQSKGIAGITSNMEILLKENELVKEFTKEFGHIFKLPDPEKRKEEYDKILKRVARRQGKCFCQ